MAIPLTQQITNTITIQPAKKTLYTMPIIGNKQPLFRNPLTGNLISSKYASKKRIIDNIAKANAVINVYNQDIDKFNILYQNLASTQILTNREDVGFFKYRVMFNNIDSLHELYDTLRALQERIFFNNTFVMTHYILGWSDNNKPIFRTFSPDNLRIDFAYFQTDIDDMETGEQYGSDPINTNTNQLMTNNIIIYVQQINRPQGISDKIIFPIVDVNKISGNKKNNCLVNTINYLKLDIPQKYKENFDVFLKYIKKEDGGLCNIVSNIIKDLDIISITKRSPEIKETENKGKIRKIVLYSINKQDFELQYRHYLPENKINVVFCNNSNHIDVATSLDVEGLFCNSRGILYKLNCAGFAYELYNGDCMNLERKVVEHETIIDTVNYVFFDYETVIDYEKNNCVNPYSISYFYFSHKELINMTLKTQEGFNIEDEITKKIFEEKKRCVNNTGFNCNTDFITFLKEFQRDKKVVLVSYNGANFDNFLLYDGIKKSEQNKEDDLKISKVLFNGNQILNFTINGTHALYDLNRFIAGSLSDNCKSFGVPAKYCKKSGYNFDEIQELYDTLPKEEFISKLKETDKLEEYNNNDVYSLAIIFCKWFRAIYDLKDDFEFGENLYDFTNKITIGSLGYTAFNKNFKKLKIELPALTIEKYQLMQKFKVAGRVDLFGKPNNKVSEKVYSIDRCSQYPYLMCVAPVYYPCGKIITQKKYIKPDVNIGWFMCNIDQRPLIAQNLPPIYPKKIFNTAGDSIENDFDNYEPLENYFINNYEIENLRKYGVIVDIIDHKENFTFTQKIKGCELFKFVLNWMKLKNDQDTLKTSKSPLYNASMRETYKLLMNCISGKVIEGLHVDKTTIINDKEKFQQLTSKYNVNVINEIGNDIYLSYKVSEAEIIKQQKPIYLGCLIYTYSRGCMYDDIISVIGKKNCLYMDTDSIQMTEENFNIWKAKAEKEIVPHWEEVEQVDIRYKEHKKYEEGTKVFGSFENELEDNNINYYLQKKFHGHFMKNGDNIDYCKVRFKGVQRSSLFLTGNEDIITQKDDKFIKNKTDKEINKFCFENKIMEIGADFSVGKGTIKNQYEFFEKLHIDKFCSVLCRGLKRVVKNSNRGVGIEETEKFNKNHNTVQATFTIKNIIIN